MKKSSLIAFILLFSGHLGYSQTIPAGSMFLGQTPPGAVPEKFRLSVNAGSFAAERIAISNDGKEIYYTEVKNYYPATGDTIKYCRFSENQWSGPFNLFPGYLSPALSISGDTLYFQTAKGVYETFFSVRKGNHWTPPQRMLTNLNSAHYLQVTNFGNYYISSNAENTTGAADWCKLTVSGTDTAAFSLGRPLNTEWDNLDFYMARDESFVIVATAFGLAISYPENDGKWTSPRNLGKEINFGLASWGPYVTTDGKYLFYSTGTKPDYSDTGIIWVRFDKLIDSLKYANHTPYLQKKLENLTGFVGQALNFSIPDDAFSDDDGDTTFTCSAMLNTSQPLPLWLKFDSETCMFSGTPTEAAEFIILLTASDSEKATAAGIFKITIKEKP